MPTAGVQLSFDVPGFLTVAFLLNKEWGVAGDVFPVVGPGPVARSTSYDVTEDISAAWGIPVYGPVSFEGFGSVNFPKGNGGLNGIQGSQTVTEVLLHPKVMLDVAKLAGSSGVQVGVGYEYWLNKFGNDPTSIRPAARSHTPSSARPPSTSSEGPSRSTTRSQFRTSGRLAGPRDRRGAFRGATARGGGLEEQGGRARQGAG